MPDVYQGKPIIYSLGNFLFNGFTEPENLICWALRMTLDKKGVVEWSTVVLQLDEQGVPHPVFQETGPSWSRGNDFVMLRPATP
jgi:poly-gamma-glutamate synthesis protein (capsule biosynthesis protein)